MAMTLSITSTTATSATFGFGNLAADGTIDLQVSARSDFAWCPSPIYSIERASSGTLWALNQRATLFARCRARQTSGALEAWSNTVSFRTGDGTAQSTTPQAVMIDLAMVVVPEKVADWTGAGTIAGFPASNLGRDAPTGWKAYVSNDAHSLDVTLAGQPIDTIAVLNSNMPEAGTVTIYSATTQAGLTSGTGRTTHVNGAAFRASANLPGRRGYHGLFTFAASTNRYWRILFGGEKPAHTLYAEHVVFGRNRATKNHAIDKTESPLPRGTIERTRAGIADRVDGVAMRKVEFEIAMMTEAQYETAYGDLIYLENEPVLVVPNTRANAFLHDRILFGDLKGGRVSNPMTPRFTRGFVIESLI